MNSEREDDGLAGRAIGRGRSTITATMALSGSLILVVGLLFFGYLYGLGKVPLTSPNEGLYAECAREMLETGEWVNPRINTVMYWEKPPVLYWLTALSMKVFGENAAAARLPSALAGALTALCTFLFASHFWDRRVGWLSLGILCSALYYSTQCQLVMFDSLLTFFLAAALFSYFLASERRWLYLVSGVALALAVMTKGLVALVFFVAIVGLYYLLTRRAPAPGWALFPSLGLFLLVAAPWHIFMALRHPHWVWFYFVNEHILRFLGERRPMDYSHGSFYEQTLRSLALMAPWGLFLPVAVVAAWRRRRTELLPLLWFAVPLVFFSISRAQGSYYMMVAAPAMAILTAVYLVHAGSRRVLAWGFGALAVLLLVAIVVISHHQYRDVFRTDRATLTVVILVGLLVAASLTAWLASKRWEWGAAMAVAGFMAVKVIGFNLIGPIVPNLSAKPVASYIASHMSDLPGRAGVVLEGRLENHSSLLFYLPAKVRPIRLVNGLWGDLMYGSQFENKRRLFITQAQALRATAQGRCFYCCSSPTGSRADLTVLCRAGNLAVVAGGKLAERTAPRMAQSARPELRWR